MHCALHFYVSLKKKKNLKISFRFSHQVVFQVGKLNTIFFQSKIIKYHLHSKDHENYTRPYCDTQERKPEESLHYQKNLSCNLYKKPQEKQTNLPFYLRRRMQVRNIYSQNFFPPKE